MSMQTSAGSAGVSLSSFLKFSMNESFEKEKITRFFQGHFVRVLPEGPSLYSCLDDLASEDDFEGNQKLHDYRSIFSSPASDGLREKENLEIEKAVQNERSVFSSPASEGASLSSFLKLSIGEEGDSQERQSAFSSPASECISLCSYVDSSVKEDSIIKGDTQDYSPYFARGSFQESSRIPLSPDAKREESVSTHTESSHSPMQSVRSPLPGYLKNRPDLYQILRVSLHPQDSKWSYKNDLKSALEPYTFELNRGDPRSLKMIKIVGEDCRIKGSPKRESKYSYNNNKPFFVSSTGAECLCEIIREDVRICYFMFIAKLEKGKMGLLAEGQIGDETINILAHQLPRNRFHLLNIGGSFGNESARTFLEQLPSLLKRGWVNPSIHIYGDRITEKEVCDECAFFAGLDLTRAKNLGNKRG